MAGCFKCCRRTVPLSAVAQFLLPATKFFLPRLLLLDRHDHRPLARARPLHRRLHRIRQEPPNLSALFRPTTACTVPFCSTATGRTCMLTWAIRQLLAARCDVLGTESARARHTALCWVATRTDAARYGGGEPEAWVPYVGTPLAIAARHVGHAVCVKRMISCTRKMACSVNPIPPTWRSVLGTRANNWQACG